MIVKEMQSVRDQALSGGAAKRATERARRSSENGTTSKSAVIRHASQNRIAVARDGTFRNASMTSTWTAVEVRSVAGMGYALTRAFSGSLILSRRASKKYRRKQWSLVVNSLGSAVRVVVMISGEVRRHLRPVLRPCEIDEIL